MNDPLYKEICRHPNDDTLRLAYADWLDENGDPDRAEFIRTQYELLKPWPMTWPHSDGPICKCARCVSRTRESDLRFAHPEWSRLPCRECGGWGFVTDGLGVVRGLCLTCQGTGDLFRSRVFGPGLDPNAVRETAHAVTFARGFPDSVSCTLAEAFDQDGTPTPWACEVVRRTPVTRFVLTDADPPGRDSGDKQYPFHWRDTMFTHGSGYVIADQCARNYRTLERALDVFALAAGELVRRCVYGEKKK